MKFFLTMMVALVTAFVLGLFMPWWSVAIAGAIAGFAIRQKPWVAFAAAFTGVFTLWFLMAYFISSSNAHILAGKISTLVLKANNPAGLILLSAFIGALVAGFAAASGSWFKKAFDRS